MINGKHKVACSRYASMKNKQYFFTELYKEISIYLLRVPVTLIQLIMSSENPRSLHFQFLGRQLHRRETKDNSRICYYTFRSINS
jgi:hypothetical protein